MKRTAILLTATVLLAGCSTWSGKGTPGNPGATPYAGEPGSVFDPNAGPPRPVHPDIYDRPSSELMAPASPVLPQVSPAPAPAR